MSDPIRILHVFHEMNRGGAEAMVMNLHRHIDRSRVQFDFLVHTEEPGLYDEEIRALGGRIYAIPWFTGYNAGTYARACSSFFAAHPEHSIVHGHVARSAAIYLSQAKKDRRFTIAHAHSAAPQKSLRRLVYQTYALPTRRLADAFFGCSTDAGISLFGKAIVASDRYLNLKNAIDLEQFSFSSARRAQTRTSFGIGDEELLIGTVGRITYAKNPEYLLKIFEAACALDSRIRCLWVGTGELEAEYRQKARPLIDRGKLIMTGVRSDVPALMDAMDAFVLPSRFEGLGIVAVEAQTGGLPCLLTNTLPDETDVTGRCRRLSLSSPPSVWAEQALDAARAIISCRCSPLDAVRAAGYDIVETSRWLCDFYCSHASQSR